MGTEEDLGIIRTLVEPLANQAGFFKGRMLAMITEANVKAIYAAVGEDGVRAATEAIVRIGKEED